MYNDINKKIPKKFYTIFREKINLRKKSEKMCKIDIEIIHASFLQDKNNNVQLNTSINKTTQLRDFKVKRFAD